MTKINVLELSDEFDSLLMISDFDVEETMASNQFHKAMVVL